MAARGHNGRMVPSDKEKAEIWRRYYERRPVRVPVRLNTNPRIIIADPALNPEGFTFEQAARDPRVHIEVALRHQLHLRTVLNQYTDGPTELPEAWDIGLSVYNVYDAAMLGAKVHFPPGQVPATEPILDEANKHSIFEQDIDHPMDTPFIREHLDFWHEMEAICRDLRFEGRPVRLRPWDLSGTDGPLTAACSLRGTDFLVELLDDPEYADRLLAFIMRAAANRRKAMWQYWGDRAGRWNGLADDSIATLSTEMVKERLVPLYREFYEMVDADTGRRMPRSIHLCGDATRHFAMLNRELDVCSFDTGFPVNHGALRRELGPEIEISGGPEVSVLLNGTPQQVYARTREILLSGIKEGGRFILQEANNLPPRCPPANLEAMYAAALEHGRQ